MKSTVICISFIFGASLLGLNIFGLTQDISPDIKELDRTYGLRFPYEAKTSYAKTIKDLASPSSLDDPVARVTQLSNLIKQRMTHPNWHKVPPGEFNISVPIWENYILYALRFVYDEPQIARYHFSNYKRSLERGIGICGDSAIILSSLLRQDHIDHDILVYPGHVIVRFKNKKGDNYYADADFNVIFPEVKGKPLSKNDIAIKHYTDAGYSKAEIDYLVSIYAGKINSFDDHIHFMTKRYYFEEVSYYLKWLIPLILCMPLLFKLRNKWNPR